MTYATPTKEYRRTLEESEVEEAYELLEAAATEDTFIFGYITQGPLNVWELVTIHSFAHGADVVPYKTIRCYAWK